MQNNRIISIVLVALAASVVGCSKGVKPRAFNVDVTARPELADATTRVHLVAVSDSELSDWETKLMSEYWQPEDSFRLAAEGGRDESDRIVYEIVFDSSHMTAFFPMNDRLWGTWIKDRNATWLLVLADFPGQHQDMPGATDDRRLILPLDRKRWEGGVDTLEIQLYEGIVKAKTVPKAEATK